MLPGLLSLILLIPSGYILLPDLYGGPGEGVTAEVRADLEGAIACQMTLSFDQDLLTPGGIEAGEMLPEEALLFHAPTAKGLKVALASPVPLEDGELLKLHLTLSEDGKPGSKGEISAEEPLFDETIVPEIDPGSVTFLYIISLDLRAGLNLISIPLNPPGGMTLGDLSDMMGGDLNCIIRFDPLERRFKLYRAEERDRMVDGDEGYLISMKRAKRIEFHGLPWSRDVIELKKGLNLISADPAARLGLNVEELTGMFEDQVSAVIWIDPETGRFRSYVPFPGNPLGETPITPGLGYIVIARGDAAAKFVRSEVERTTGYIPIGYHPPAILQAPNGERPESDLIKMENAVQMEGEVKAVHDGDTISVLLDGGEEEIVRLVGINAPEINGPDGNPEPFAMEAKSFVDKILAKRVTLLMSSDERFQRDDYNRLLCVVICDGENLNAALLSEGLASRMFFRNNMLNFPAWEDLEVEARSHRKGIWSNLSSRGIVLNEINPNPGSVRDSQGEFLELYNMNDYPVNIGGWRLITTSKEIALPETVIPGHGYLILARTEEGTFRSIYASTPSDVTILRLKGLSLVNTYSPAEGLVLWLKDNVGWIQDGLVYRLSWDKKGANGTDRTLERRCPDVINVGDSSIGGGDDANWDPSLEPFGTPGLPNSVGPPQIGDVSLNGQITAYDASLILRYILGYEDLHMIQIRSADVDENGRVEREDAAIILRRVVGLIRP